VGKLCAVSVELKSQISVSTPVYVTYVKHYLLVAQCKGMNKPESKVVTALFNLLKPSGNFTYRQV
jgi:hypothetical protein